MGEVMTGFKSKKDMAQNKLAQPAQEPVVVVAVNKSGAIRMEYPDGSAFDISKHIGQRFYTTPPQRPWVDLTDEEKLSNGLAMALHDAVLIRIGKDDEATRQAIARIDKLVEKYTNEAAHGIKEKNT
jgi:hypothetical protein